MAQVKVDRGGEKLNGYAAYTYRFRQNRQRGVEIRNSSIALGASTILSPKALAYAEYAFDSSSAKSGDDDGDIALRHYFPKSNTMALGVDCTLSAADSLAASLLLFRTNNLKGSHLNVSYRHQYSPESALEVSVAPMVFSDLAFNVTGARATVASLRYSVKF